jgi:acetyltransferase-like isoleucine patch superfamily enzyme
MAIQSNGGVVVATTAVPIAAGVNFAIVGANVIITNGAAAIAVGPTPGVTMGTGLLIAANATVQIPGVRAGDQLWAICATTSTISYLITSN